VANVAEILELEPDEESRMGPESDIGFFNGKTWNKYLDIILMGMMMGMHL